MHTGPGKSHRKGITILEAAARFSDKEAVEREFIAARWPNGIACVEVRLSEHPGAPHPQAPALPLPRLPQGLLGKDRHGHAGLEPTPSASGASRPIS